jgi:small-conductance mechanosensitive channel
VTSSSEEDLSTPRRALQSFVDASRQGDYQRAATALDLSAIPARQREATGPTLARQLQVVLDQKLLIDWDKVSDDPHGDPNRAVQRISVGSIPLAQASAPVLLTRSPVGDWRVSASTVSRIPALYDAYGPGWVGEHMPHILFSGRVLGLEAWQWMGLVLAILLSLLLGIGIARGVLAVGDRLVRRTQFKWDDELLEAGRPPAKYLAALLVFGWLAEPLRLSLSAQATVGQLRRSLLITFCAWLVARCVEFGAGALEKGLCYEKNEGEKRSIQTQIGLMRRVILVVVALVGTALVLTQFEVVVNVGMSLLASAGIAGIVLGLAAQKSISSLLAGIQLSMTQPIRIGDTVIVEGEWGTIEEINLTYVVVKIWDLRRLVVPITRFLEQPFQNWTKMTHNLLGTVEIPADHSTPVDLVRAELTRLCEAHPLWDKKSCGLQVTAASDRTMTLRALVSAEDAGKLWDLRCDIRERLISFLQRLEDGRYLPRVRVEAEAPSEKVPRVSAIAG